REELAAALSMRGLTLEVWKRFDDEYRGALCDDLREGAGERAALYDAKCRQEQARRAGAPAAPPSLPVPQHAPAALTGTAASAELAAAVFEAASRMPFLPPPQPAGQGKRSPKTVQSMAAHNNVGGQTMALDAEALQRPTPSVPFAGTTDDAPVYVPPLDARQYVSLI